MEILLNMFSAAFLMCVGIWIVFVSLSITVQETLEGPGIVGVFIGSFVGVVFICMSLITLMIEAVQRIPS